MNNNKKLTILPNFVAMGVIRGREIEMSPGNKIVYVAIDADKETEELAKEVTSCWLLYTSKPKEITNEEPTDPTIPLSK